MGLTLLYRRFSIVLNKRVLEQHSLLARARTLASTPSNITLLHNTALRYRNIVQNPHLPSSIPPQQLYHLKSTFFTVPSSPRWMFILPKPISSKHTNKSHTSGQNEPVLVKILGHHGARLDDSMLFGKVLLCEVLQCLLEWDDGGEKNRKC